MKYLLSIILIVSIPFVTNAQDKAEEISPQLIEANANDITSEYNKKLFLTGVQLPLFKKKVTEFLYKAEDIKNSLSGKEKLDALYLLQTEEAKYMQDILTQTQYRQYLKLRSNIQPLERS
ncbi:MAG: hypothetical protein HKN99_11885 [Winogradskyella sp.]|nr:hypothetical protein [Bacteroidia bacterium]NNC46573.1 hypothetical protein [Winogradskyella sp.]